MVKDLREEIVKSLEKREMEDKRKEIVIALDEELQDLKREIEKKKEELEELDDWEMDENEYDEFLDGCYSDIDVAGCKYSTSAVLKAVDEVRYNIGKSEEEDEQRENRREELESEIEELEDEFKEMMEGEDGRRI